MKVLIILIVANIVYALFFSKKGFLRFKLFWDRNLKLYNTKLANGIPNIQALKEISIKRHPELSEQVHQKMVNKFDEINALINFMFWGIEGHLLTKQELTDENALALINAGSVVQEGHKYRVNIDENVLQYGKSPVNSKSEQIKKMWYDQLRKSKEFPQEIAEKFLIVDNIDPLKFKENHDYYIMDRYGEHKPTPSCFDPINKPMGFPYWFASAYPDIVKYYSSLQEAKLIEHVRDMHIELLENGQELSPVIYPPSTVMKNTKAMQEGLKYSPGLGILDKDGCFKIDILYKFKEYYKRIYPDKELECQ